MCGIFFSVARGRPRLPNDETVVALKARGPDSYKALDVLIPGKDANHLYLTFTSSVLALRGETVQYQPLRDPGSGSILCWNGEAWKVDGEVVSGNDTTKIFQLLLAASTASESESSQDISLVLEKLAGPFAFVFYNALTSTVYYARDRLGRRSLLIDKSSSQSEGLTLCSIDVLGSRPPSSEVLTGSIHLLSLSNGRIEGGTVPWRAPLPSINKLLPSGELSSTPSKNSISHLQQQLTESLQLRVRDIPDHSHSQINRNSAKVAILFSGGLDCTLLALLTHKILPINEVIDLVNVAFENPRSIAARSGPQRSPYESCPDRITGRSSYRELTQVCSERTWRFVAANVPYAEAMAHKPTIISLMHPHNTEMDLSIAMALYFAARGQGDASTTTISSSIDTIAYTSTARVLLSGLGADELFAGYSRHSAAFTRGGFGDLARELELDFNRIGSRNLGRDDRVMSHWGKEVRFPYLDEDFVRFALELPVWEKAGFRPNRIAPKHYEEILKVNSSEDLEPSKMLLRLLMWEQGMKSAASERKRAIQFGAKTAKMDTGKGRAKGTDLVIAVR